MNPWPTVQLGEVLRRSENVEGVPEISQGYCSRLHYGTTRLVPQPPANFRRPFRMPERGCMRSTTRSTSTNRGVLDTFGRAVRGEVAAAGPLDTAALRLRKEARA
jgi:hypothetical protein